MSFDFSDSRANLKFIQRALLAITETRRVGAIQDARARQEAAEYHRELLLFLDDCKLHGLDWEEPQCRPIITRAWLEKIGYQVEEDGPDASIDQAEQEMQDDHRRLDF